MASDVQRARLRRAPVVIAALALACTTPEAPAASGEPTREEAPVASGALTVDDAPPAPSIDVAAQPEILDRREDGALLTGTLEPAPADSDPERVIALRVEGAGDALGRALDGLRVLDARFVGDRAIATLGADHVLRVHTADGASRELDAQVEPPLAVAGSTIAYGRGDMPLFELARADVETGAVVAWTEGMAPVWSPALSPDGREAVFVSGASGAPRLHRVALDGAPVALPGTGAFPGSLRSPEWRDGALRFEDESGTRRAVDLQSGRLLP